MMALEASEGGLPWNSSSLQCGLGGLWWDDMDTRVTAWDIEKKSPLERRMSLLSHW